MNFRCKFGAWAFVFVLATLAVEPTWLAAQPPGKDRASLGPIPWSSLRLRDHAGEAIAVSAAGPTVVAFLGTECPLAKLYASRLQALADRFADEGVAFLGVNSNVQDSPLEIKAYARTHGIEFPIAKDIDQSIADAFGATRTPEIFVVTKQGRVAYQGRVDDQYQPGITRSAPTRHDLREALEDVVAGRSVRQPNLPSVGCLITRTDRRSPAETPLGDGPQLTFNRDIAPILFQRCAECHRDGEIGPMELIDYDEVVGWGEMILEVIDEGRMPPWHADPKIGEFAGAREMPSRERDLIARWLDLGMPEGDAADRTDAPEPSRGWHLADAPDHVFSMRDEPFEVPAEGIIEYQYYVVDPGWETDRWVRAAQVMPGNRDVVHHTIVFVRPPDHVGAEGVGWVGSYVPGQRTVVLPPGHARRIPAGSKFVFQMHYTPTGSREQDLSRVGIWEVDPAAVTHEVTTHVAINHQFEIPPQVEDYGVRIDANRLPTEGMMLGVMPHMHLRGKSFLLHAVDRDGDVEPLLSVPQYDFNWQHWYQFARPIELSKLDRLEMRVHFDNSRSNPANPEPNEYVVWGDQTDEEMAIAFFDVARPRGSQHRLRRRPQPTSQQRERALAKVEVQIREFLERWDRDRDGVVTREETTRMFRKHGFGQLDLNGDRRIDRDELAERMTDQVLGEIFP